MRNKVTLLQRITEKAFGKYLFYTNVITSGILLAQGDFIQQTIVKKQNGQPLLNYDYERSWQMFAVGLIQGPFNHNFYKTLDSLLPPVPTVRVVLMKIVCDQLIASPIVITTFFIGMGIFRRDSIATIKHEMKQKFLFVYAVDMVSSPPAQFFNFYFVSPKYRVLYLNVLTMVYDSFLAYVKFSM